MLLVRCDTPGCTAEAEVRVDYDYEDTDVKLPDDWERYKWGQGEGEWCPEHFPLEYSQWYGPDPEPKSSAYWSGPLLQQVYSDYLNRVIDSVQPLNPRPGAVIRFPAVKRDE